jgi:hypothetical protein
MQLDETLFMSLPRNMIEQIILGRSNPLNRHLVKLVGFDFPPELRRQIRREIKNWLDEIQSLRFKPRNRTGPFKFYFDLLFDYPFGGVEVQNVFRIMNFIADECENARPTRTPEEMIAWLRDFHMRLAERLHDGEDVLDMTPE